MLVLIPTFHINLKTIFMDSSKEEFQQIKIQMQQLIAEMQKQNTENQKFNTTHTRNLYKETDICKLYKEVIFYPFTFAIVLFGLIAAIVKVFFSP